MEQALLNLSIIVITPRCESGYPSSHHSLIGNHLHSIPLLLSMEEKGRPEHTPMIQAILKMLHEGYAPQSSASLQDLQVGPPPFNWLLSRRKTPNFHHTTSNDSSPTLTHLPFLYGCVSLIRHLVERRIDLTVADISGLIALHCAHLDEEWENIRIPLRGGELFSIKFKLGRSPRDLLPEESYLADWLDGDLGTAESSPHIAHTMDHEIALGKHFTALEPEKEHENYSVHGGSDSGSDAFNNSGEDDEGMYIISPTLDPGPSVGTLYVLWSWVSCLVLAWLVFSYFMFPLYPFHYLVPHAVM